MPRKGLAAQDEKEADRPGERGGDAGRREGRAHEIVFKHGRRRDRGNGRELVVAVGLALDVDVAGHDEVAVPDPYDLDLRAVEARQHRAGHDLLDRADHGGAGAEVEHPVDGVDQRVELVRAEHDRDLEVVADAPGDLDHALLVGGIERDQRLVEQRRRGRPSRAWLSSTRCRSPPESSPIERRARSRAPTSSSAQSISRRAALSSRSEAEAAADRGARDHVPAGEPETRRSRRGSAACSRSPGCRARPAGRARRSTPRGDRNEAEGRPHQRRLAGAVRPEHADELALAHGKAGRREDVPATEPDRDGVEGERGHWVGN